jgi:biofilm PGA synthesis N-glycosyltransferase PgaC
MANKDYVLITSARNEEGYIEKTINAVIDQSILPKKWVIVDDGSYDRTAQIVLDYQKEHDFIHLIIRRASGRRKFGSKASALKLATKYLENYRYRYIGNLDADISFDKYYYEEVISKFYGNDNLGIAGGVRYDLLNGKFVRVSSSENSVGGAVQFFVRDCFEKVGGYIPLSYGGIDSAAEISARMNGWKVKLFPDIRVYHHRLTSNSDGKILIPNLRYGIKYYMLGYHPLFFLLMAFRKAFRNPLPMVSLLWIAGYLIASLRKNKRELPGCFIEYLRSEQMERIRSKIK